jgi:hypothetical protein
VIAAGCAILPAAPAIIPIESSSRDQVTAFSARMTTTSAVGQAAAPATSGGLIEFLGWPAISWIGLPACALAPSAPRSRFPAPGRHADQP